MGATGSTLVRPCLNPRFSLANSRFPIGFSGRLELNLGGPAVSRDWAWSPWRGQLRTCSLWCDPHLHGLWFEPGSSLVLTLTRRWFLRACVSCGSGFSGSAPCAVFRLGSLLRTYVVSWWPWCAPGACLVPLVRPRFDPASIPGSLPVPRVNPGWILGPEWFDPWRPWFDRGSIPGLTLARSLVPLVRSWVPLVRHVEGWL